ncbi:MAG: hypothetical protein ACXVXC_02010 [Nocardioidaceae bacterium]
MSKMDDLRAMREARYERMSARAGKPNAAPSKPKLPTPPTPGPVEAEQVANSGEPVEALRCGHRAISGRTCTREQGHAAKSHRYS